MPGRSVSSGCLSRQVSSRLSRNCRNERRFDIAPQRLCDRSYDEVDQTLARTAVFLLSALLLAVGLQLEQQRGGCNIVLRYHRCSSARDRKKRKWTATTCFFVA